MLSPVSTPADDIARRHYEQQQLLAARSTEAARQAWVTIDRSDIAGSWAQQIPALTQRLTAAQRVAASGADSYVDAALAAGGAEVRPAGRVLAAGVAGVASDGRPLGSLLVQPAITSLRAISVGFDPIEALQAGFVALSQIMTTQVADAGRVADGLAMAARPAVGYVRMLAPPSCSRCAVLAGRHYRWNSGFLRHPRCDCRHIPVAESMAGDVTVDSRRYFDSLARDQQDKIFTVDGARAIRDGADLNRVVNARRGMTAAGTTTELATRHTGARLMPERIYRLAAGDRDLALSLLRQHGFIA
ncbi:MAG: hypothetical protein JWN67_5028 [Actinomycetia bacterium]|nr:hypothetical protein [Actinomycetes bacterium]